MMKLNSSGFACERILFLVLGVLLAFSVPARCDESQARALFVSLVQDPPVLSSRAAIKDLTGFAQEAGIKALFVQIYRSDQAWFPSQIADSSPYEQCFKKLGEDPFALLIRQSHAKGIKVHAWLNLLSLGENSHARFLEKYGPDVLTRNLKKKKKIEDYKIDDQYFLEPGDPRVRADLTAMVEDILRTYPDLDGVMFDYIRYPDMAPHYGYTKINVERFKKATDRGFVNEDSQAWKDWKRKQVTELLTGLVRRTRKLRPDIQVSATGCMPYARAYYEAYQDWPLWLEQKLVDFVTIMNYSPDPDEFERWIATAKEKVTDFSRVKIAVGAYKLLHAPETFEQEYRICERMGESCAVFHYGSLLENSALKDFLIEKVK